MDLKSGYPFWTVKNGLLAAFPPLLDDIDCDVAVVGAGISGALIAHSLAEAGLDVVVLDKRDIGWGSTAASTALLQYEIDTELVPLARAFGEPSAVAAYRACEGAISELGELAAHVGNSGFTRTQSLYLASTARHAKRLRDECALRRKHGFAVTVLEDAQLRSRFGFGAPLALLTEVAAQVDPYRLTYAILGKLRERGVRVFDRTGVCDWKYTSRGLRLGVERNVSVRCGHVVIAAGYETQQYLRRKVAANHSSYALVTEPVEGGLGPLRRMLLWESARPYLYLRSTQDNRIIVGGEDDTVDLPARRDAAIPRKAGVLMRKLAKLHPGKELEASYAWAGTFAETRDGLPFFGPHEQHGSRVHFAMAYGGNGIVFSVIGAAIMRAHILRKAHPLKRLFSFERL
ncbi:MAG TPA: FAD-dependent oxidoreductase [Rudaea sp.]|nr:FAD-dependent oxidoreductase [Rudaea sp.]